MAERRMGIMALVVSICLCLLPLQARAASTTDAKEPIATEKDCTLTLTYSYQGAVFPDLPVTLYKIAHVSADFQYTLTSAFRDTGLDLNGIRTSGEWNVIRSTLEAFIVSNGITEDASALTDPAGQACFPSLTPGLYLAVPGTGMAGDIRCVFASALVALPGLDTESLWQYRLTVASKPTPIPPEDLEEEIVYHILKLWKGDSANLRPSQIEVEIFRNGQLYETILLSEENNWSYSWTTKADGANWTVSEKNVPSGYTAALEKRDTTFVLTNTHIPDRPTPEPDDTPKTGDTANILFYLMLMSASGISLVLLGLTGGKKRHEIP